MISRFSPFAISFTLTSLFFINLCNLIFRCGCRSLWAGAAVACNIHAQQGHHCPWCSHATGGYAIVMTLMCIPQLGVCFTRWSWPVRAIVATAMFPAAGLVIAGAFGWLGGYWGP
ncbi:MAG TPA: hypothetical protein VNX18_10065 [Bryobacteraceae bacterium]|nr:hypothetical protein [Bryobacteraceae bacterium]